MKVVVKGKNINVVESVTVANTMWARGMGLMFKKSLREDEGMLIDPCNSIHTFFMNFKIDEVGIHSYPNNFRAGSSIILKNIIITIKDIIILFLKLKFNKKKI